MPVVRERVILESSFVRRWILCSGFDSPDGEEGRAADVAAEGVEPVGHDLVAVVKGPVVFGAGDEFQIVFGVEVGFRLALAEGGVERLMKCIGALAIDGDEVNVLGGVEAAEEL